MTSHVDWNLLESTGIRRKKRYLTRKCGGMRHSVLLCHLRGRNCSFYFFCQVNNGLKEIYITAIMEIHVRHMFQKLCEKY
jgi:hypothetical protein